MRLTESDLSDIITLLHTHTFAAVGMMYGAENKYIAYQWIKRFLIKNDIDHKQFIKRQHRHTPKPQETPKPKLIRTYFDHGLLVKVFETRYALWR